MKILHVFQKDVRHLWPHISVYLALLVLTAFLDPTFTGARSSGAFDVLSGFVLSLACWNLLIAVIHEERLPGDRQYWLTLPILWRELLGAKALFVVLFIQLPLFLYQAGVLMAVGIPLGEHLSTLLWRQFFFLAFYVLPVGAVAAITRSLGQVILIALLILVPFWFAQDVLFSVFRTHWNGSGETYLALTMALVLATGLTAILMLQYWRRRTQWSGLAMAALAGSLAAILLGGDRTLRAASRPREIAPIRISLDTSAGRKSTVTPSGRPDLVTADLPIFLDGVPADTELNQNDVSIWIEGARKLELPTQGGVQRIQGNQAWLTMFIQRGYFDLMVAGHAVTIRGTADFTAFRTPQAFPLPRGRGVVIPRVGTCFDHQDESAVTFFCYTPFPRAAISVGTAESHRNWIIPHGFAKETLPTASRFEPLVRFTSQLPYRNWEAIGDLHLFVAQPLPPVRVAFELQNVRLDDMVVRNYRR